MPAVRAIASIDLSAMTRNIRLVQERCDDAEVCAVVKADGYGHGSLLTARTAVQESVKWLAVATVREAADLRREFNDQRILILGPLTHEETDWAISLGVDVTATCMNHLLLLESRACSIGTKARVHIKFDSGMGRRGTRSSAECGSMLNLCCESDHLVPAGIWTHFATADDPRDKFLDRQIHEFRSVADAARIRAPAILAHCANSAATLARPDTHFDMVRCGVAIYGLDPFQRDPAEQGLSPVLTLSSYVAETKQLPAGATTGYGRSWTTPGPTWIGLVPVGYGDGYGRDTSNRTSVLVGGRKRRVVGTVSMDSLMVDLGPDDGSLLEGSEAVLLGRQGNENVTSEEIAKLTGTINYEITCSLSPRVPRRATK